jgi:putative flippase GtrA
VSTYMRSFATKQSAHQVVRMGSIGVLNTVVYFALINLFRTLGIFLLARTVLAFVIATALSYVLNRRWTFKIRHRVWGLGESLGFLAVNLVAMGVTAAIVLGADALTGPGPMSRLQENLANLVAGAILLVPKLAGYRDLVFRRSIDLAAAQAAHPHGERVASDLPERG